MFCVYNSLKNRILLNESKQCLFELFVLVFLPNYLNNLENSCLCFHCRGGGGHGTGGRDGQARRDGHHLTVAQKYRCIPWSVAAQMI